MTSTDALDLRPQSAHIGADVAGLDLGRLAQERDPATLTALRGALDRHIVLRFRRQTLTPQQMEALGLAFGPLLNLKRPENNTADHIAGVEFLKIISNALTVDGRPLGDGSPNAQDWHSDGAMKPRPATYTYFYARKVPRTPPRTYWMNAYRVYESLPDEVKRRIAGLRVIHHQFTAGNEYPLPPPLPLETRMSGPHHPLVRLHPATGLPSLYLPHRSDALVVGMSAGESALLISYLRDFTRLAPFWWATAMEVNDVVIWDNRPALHRRDGWDPSEERVLWHLANQGEAPIPYGAATSTDRAAN
jgi:taurine dioxygenase